MNVGGIDSSRIEAMLAQLKAASARLEENATHAIGGQSAAPAKLDFADALKASLDQVNSVQLTSEQLGKKFAMGDDKVSLSDVMIGRYQFIPHLNGGLKCDICLLHRDHDIRKTHLIVAHCKFLPQLLRS